MMDPNIQVPYYAVHKDGLIAGFFGAFRFLSNFYILENGVWYEEMCFPTVEHAYQAAKWPAPLRSKFIGVSPGRAKAIGQLAAINKKKWQKRKYDIMYELVRQKFTNNATLREMLWMTDGCTLEERNSWQDQDWGTDENGVGDNNLGKILMNVRERLKIGPEDQF